MALFDEIKGQLEGCDVPMQFAGNIQVEKVVSSIPINIAEQISEVFRRECSEHDNADRESWEVAATIYAGN